MAGKQRKWIKERTKTRGVIAQKGVWGLIWGEGGSQGAAVALTLSPLNNNTAIAHSAERKNSWWKTLSVRPTMGILLREVENPAASGVPFLFGTAEEFLQTASRNAHKQWLIAKKVPKTSYTKGKVKWQWGCLPKHNVQGRGCRSEGQHQLSAEDNLKGPEMLGPKFPSCS